MIPFLSSPLIFASVRKNSSEDVNTNVSVPSLFSYCPKEPLNYGIHCTGVSLFSVVESDSENQVEISGLLREKASLKFKDHKLSMYRVHMYFRCNLYEEIFMARSFGKAWDLCASGTGLCM